MSRLTVGETLVLDRVIDVETLARACARPRKPGQKFGEVLIEMGAVTVEELRGVLSSRRGRTIRDAREAAIVEAIRAKARPDKEPVRKIARMKLGEALIASGFIDQDTLRAALARHRETGKRLGEVLIEMDAVTERDIRGVLTVRISIPFVALRNYLIDRQLAALVPRHLAERYQLVPINKAGNKLTVACADPWNVLAVDDIQLRTGLQVKAVHAEAAEIRDAIEQLYLEEDLSAFVERYERSVGAARVEEDATAVVEHDESSGGPAPDEDVTALLERYERSAAAAR